MAELEEEILSEEGNHLVNELKEVTNELQLIELNGSRQDQQNEDDYKQKIEQFSEAISERDKIIEKLQLSLQYTQSEYETQKTKVEVEELHNQVKKVSSQLALQDTVKMGNSSKQYMELSEKLIKMQEQKVSDKSKQFSELENMEKLFTTKLNQEKEQLKNNLQQEFEEGKLVLIDQKSALQNELYESKEQCQLLQDSNVSQSLEDSQEIAVLKDRLKQAEEDHQQEKKTMNDNLKKTEFDHELAIQKLKEDHESSKISLEHEIDIVLEQHKEYMGVSAEQQKNSNLKNLELNGKLEQTQCEKVELQTLEKELMKKIEDMKEKTRTDCLAYQKANTDLENKIVDLQTELIEKTEMIYSLDTKLETLQQPASVEYPIDPVEHCQKVNVEDVALLRNCLSKWMAKEQVNQGLSSQKEFLLQQEKLLEHFVQLFQGLKGENQSISNKKLQLSNVTESATDQTCHTSRSEIDSAMSENSYCSHEQIPLHSPPESLVSLHSNAENAQQPGQLVDIFSNHFHKMMDHMELCLQKAFDKSTKPDHIAPLTYSEDFNELLDDKYSHLAQLLFTVMHQQEAFLTSFKQYLAAQTTNTSLPLNIFNRWQQLCAIIRTYLQDTNKYDPVLSSQPNDDSLEIYHISQQEPSMNTMNEAKDEEYDKELLKLLSQVTTQLLHYYSVSQSSINDQHTLSLSASPEQDFEKIPDSLCLSFDNDAIGLDNTAASEEILEDMEKDQQVKQTLKSSLCPNLISILKGKPRSIKLEDLQTETQEFIITLQARIGMLKVYMHSHQDLQSFHQISPELDTLITSQMLSFSHDEGNPDALYTSLKGEVIPDSDKIQHLLDHLRADQTLFEQLKSELHQAQGLLAGSQEQNHILEQQNQSLDQLAAKLAQELEIVKIKMDHKPIEKVIEAKETDYETKRDIKNKVRAYLSSKSKANMDFEELQARISELEHFLEEIMLDSEKTIEQYATNVQDLTQQLQAADRKIKSERQFIDEQAAERDGELEALVKENETLQGLVKDKDNQLINFCNLQDAIKDLREIVHDLEAQLANKCKEAQDLTMKIEALQFRPSDDLRSSIEECIPPGIIVPAENHDFHRQLDGCGPSPSTISFFDELDVENQRRNSWSASNKRVEQVLKKMDKMASTLENSLLSTACGSEEDISDKSELLDVSCQSSDIVRSMSPSSLDVLLEQKIHDLECGIETVLKHNRDLEMRLRSVKKNLEEMSIENDGLHKLHEEIKQESLDAQLASLRVEYDQVTLEKDRLTSLLTSSEVDLKQMHAKNQQLSRELENNAKQMAMYEDLETERSALQKENSNHLITISTLQSSILNLKTSDPNVENQLRETVSNLKKQNFNQEAAIASKFEEINNHKFMIEQLNNRLIAREEQIQTLTKDQTNNFHQNMFLKQNVSNTSEEVQRRAPTSVFSPITAIPSLTKDLIATDHTNSLPHQLSLENLQDVSSDSQADHTLEVTQVEQVIEDPGIPSENVSLDETNETEASFSLQHEILCLENEKEELQKVYQVQEASNEALLSEIDEANARICTMQDMLDEAQRTIDNQIQKISQQTQTVVQLLKQIKHLQRDTTKTQERECAQAKQFDEQKYILAEQIANGEQTLEIIQRQQQESLAKLQQYSNENDLYRDRIKELTSDLYERELKHQTVSEQNKNTKKQLDARILHYEETIQQLVKEKQLLSKSQKLGALERNNHSSTVQDGSISTTLQSISERIQKGGLEVLTLAERAFLHNLNKSLASSTDSLNQHSADSSLSVATSEAYSYSTKNLRPQIYEHTLQTLRDEVLSLKACLSNEKKLLARMTDEQKKATAKIKQQLKEEHLKETNLLLQNTELEKELQVSYKQQENVKSRYSQLEQELASFKTNLKKEKNNFAQVSQTLNQQRKQAAQVQEALRSSLITERRRLLEMLNNSNDKKQLRYKDEQISQLKKLLNTENIYETSVPDESEQGICTPQNFKKLNEALIFHKTQSLKLFRELQYGITSHQQEVDSLKHHNTQLQSELNTNTERPVSTEAATVDIAELYEMKEMLRKKLGKTLDTNIKQNKELQELRATASPDSVATRYSHAMSRTQRDDIERLVFEVKRGKSYRKNLIWQKMYLLYVLNAYHVGQDCAVQRLTRSVQRIYKVLGLDMNLPPQMPHVSPLRRFRSVVFTVIFVRRSQKVAACWKAKSTFSLVPPRDEDNEPRLSITCSSVSVVNRCSSFTGSTPPSKDTSNRCVENVLLQSRRNLFGVNELDEYISRVDNINNKLGIPSPRP